MLVVSLQKTATNKHFVLLILTPVPISVYIQRTVTCQCLILDQSLIRMVYHVFCVNYNNHNDKYFMIFFIYLSCMNIYTYTHIHTYMVIYIVCLYVCVCTCVDVE